MRRSSAHPVFSGLPHLDTLGPNDPVICPTCGPIEAMTSGWLGNFESATVMRCKRCLEPLFRL